MRRSNLTASLTFVLVGVVPALANAGGYIAIDGSALTLGKSGADELEPVGGRLRLGMRVSEAFDLEVHAGTSHDEATTSPEEVQVSFAGLYLKGYAPIGQRSALFGLGGVSSVNVTQTVGDIEISDDRGGFSFGVGLETELAERLDLTADWMRYLSDEDAVEQVDAVSIGLKYYF